MSLDSIPRHFSDKSVDISDRSVDGYCLMWTNYICDRVALMHIMHEQMWQLKWLPLKFPIAIQDLCYSLGRGTDLTDKPIQP